MKNILIIGARGFGREIYGGLKRFLLAGKEYLIKGFLDDNKTILDDFNYFAPIISSVENYKVEENDVFVCALGEPKAREKYINIIKVKGGTFLTFIHPSAIVSDTAEIGEGVWVSQFSSISENVRIGAFTVIHGNSVLGHDAQTGRFCSIEAHSFMGGNSKIGNSTTLHTRATLLPHITLGDNVIVGAGSVVIRNVGSGTTVFGVPAKKINF